MPKNLTEALQRFNRKERHWLVRDALGSASAQLDKDFTSRVQTAVRLRDPDFEIDPKAWWAIDFHIDWLVAALHMLRHGPESAAAPQLNDQGVITGSQQDIDLVIASGSTLVLVEAKGVGSWSGVGLDTKLARLNALPPSIIDADGKAGDIQVYFVLCSPGKPPSLDLGAWQPWMKGDDGPLHINLNAKAEAGPLLRVRRCSAAGEIYKNRTHWQTIKDRRSNKLVSR